MHDFSHLNRAAVNRSAALMDDPGCQAVPELAAALHRSSRLPPSQIAGLCGVVAAVNAATERRNAGAAWNHRR